MTRTVLALHRCPAGAAVLEEGNADDLRLRPGKPGVPRTLAEARLVAGLTMAELARFVHVSRPTVSGWEKGARRPARHYFSALAAALELEQEQVESLFAAYPSARFDGQSLPSLARMRRQSGLTQRTLAQLVGVAPTTLSMWETAGIPVAPVMATRLCEVLGTDLAALAAPPISMDIPDPRPLRRWRREARMSQREASVHLGVAVGSLARYEARQRQPSVEVARRIAVAYRRPIVDVLDACQIELLPLPSGVRWRREQVPAGIRAARIAAGLTKVALGQAIGRSGQAIRGWETGRSRPGEAMCRRLEVVLRLPAGRLPS